MQNTDLPTLSHFNQKKSVYPVSTQIDRDWLVNEPLKNHGPWLNSSTRRSISAPLFVFMHARMLWPSQNRIYRPTWPSYYVHTAATTARVLDVLLWTGGSQPLPFMTILWLSCDTSITYFDRLAMTYCWDPQHDRLSSLCMEASPFATGNSFPGHSGKEGKKDYLEFIAQIVKYSLK